MLTVALLASMSLAGPAGPVKVAIGGGPDAWTMTRGGTPYFVKGAGMGNSDPAAFAQLVKAGGNSIRTWGVGDDTKALLDRAHAKGITVTVGIWLGHVSHGFKYDDPKMVAEQYGRVWEAVRKYKDHPAVLAWTLGNEMEMNNPGPAVWEAVGELAKMVREEDPNHPVGSVVAEVSQEKLDLITKHAPDLQFLGINSYAGADTLPERLKQFGWKKPFLLTEFGPSGPWESGKTAWGATFEPTSKQKSEMYARRYKHVILDQKGRALGGYVFLWGGKMEETATWFGMHLPTGESLGTVDVMENFWTGREAARKAPVIDALRWKTGTGEFAVGDTVEAEGTWKGEGATNATWVLRQDGNPTTTNGNDPQREFADVPGVDGPKFSAPKAGRYRLFLYVRDSAGKAAVDNLPLIVR